MTAEEELEQGVILRYGIKFDKNNEMAKMTRTELQKLIMRANEEIYNIHDMLKGINHYIDSLDDRYKTFNKKLANGKADTQILIRKYEQTIDKKLQNVQNSMAKITHVGGYKNSANHLTPRQLDGISMESEHDLNMIEMEDSENRDATLMRSSSNTHNNVLKGRNYPESNEMTQRSQKREVDTISNLNKKINASSTVHDIQAKKTSTT